MPRHLISPPFRSNTTGKTPFGISTYTFNIHIEYVKILLSNRVVTRTYQCKYVKDLFFPLHTVNLLLISDVQATLQSSLHPSFGPLLFSSGT